MDNGPLSAPPVTNLRELAMVAKKLDVPRPEDLPEYEQWLSMLLASGTSLGGARPTAIYTGPEEMLRLNKFPG